jgi:anti-anti-sigma factor
MVHRQDDLSAEDWGLPFGRGFRYTSARQEVSLIMPGETPQGEETMISGPQPFSYEVGSDQAGTTRLRLSGELDMGASATLRSALHDLQHGGAQEIIVDLRGLTFLDSMGLSALLEAHQAGQDGHHKVSFIRGQRTVQRVFSVTEMDKRVEWVEPPE